MFTKNPLPFLLLALGLMLPSARAQQSLDTQRERQETTRFGEKVAATATALEAKEAEEDLGRLAPEDAPKYFTASSNTRLEYDSNAGLSYADPKDSMITTENLTLDYNRELAPQWSLASSISQNFFWYQSSTVNDFMGQNFTADLNYDVQDGPRLSFGPGLYRYSNMNQGDQIIQTAGFHLGVSHGHNFFEGKSSLFYGYRVDVECADPGMFDRQQHQVFTGWNQTLIPSKLVAQGFYRFAYSDYLSVVRNDSNHLIGFNLIYRISDYFSIGAFCNYNWNDSTLEIARYHNLSAGASLNASYSF